MSVHTKQCKFLSVHRHVSRTQVSSWPVCKSISVNSSLSTPAAVLGRLDPHNNTTYQNTSSEQEADSTQVAGHTAPRPSQWTGSRPQFSQTNSRDAVRFSLEPGEQDPLGQSPRLLTVSYISQPPRPLKSRQLTLSLVFSPHQPAKRLHCGRPSNSTWARLSPISPPHMKPNKTLVCGRFYFLFLGPLLTSAASLPCPNLPLRLSDSQYTPRARCETQSSFSDPSTSPHLPLPPIHPTASQPCESSKGKHP
jgi:hypothetical protein